MTNKENRLTFIRNTGEFKNKRPIGLFQCLCGKTIEVLKDSVKYNNTRSCGCLVRENAERARKLITKPYKTHGLSQTKEYATWANMWKRCTDKNHPDYDFYKDKTPPDSWKDVVVFVKDMGPCPEGKTLDRIRNLEPYGPDNCRWATPLEQSNNTRQTRFATINGETKSFAEWGRVAGISRSVVANRYARGMRETDLIQPLMR